MSRESLIVAIIYEHLENEKQLSPQMQILQKKFTSQRKLLDNHLRKDQKKLLQKLIETSYEIRAQENKEYLHYGIRAGINLALDIYA